MPAKRTYTAAFIIASAMAGLSPAAATCPVPNTISNGQVADATHVMGNFNALGNCSVSTTGSPTTGGIAVFSGPKSITLGNLAGDVATSGSTTTTLSPTGVAPGSYNSANITVDAKGRITAAENGSGSGVTGARMRRAASQSIASSSYVDLSFDTLTIDENSYWSGASPTNIIIPVAGWYLVVGEISYSSGTSGWRYAMLRVNGVTFSQQVLKSNTDGTGATIVQATGLYRFTAGDIVTLTARQTSGANINGTGTLAIVSQ